MKCFVRFLLVFSISGVWASGCSKSVTSSPEDINQKSLSLIDGGYYTEAISLLYDHLSRFPRDGESRILLASALSARNGVVLREFGNFARLLLSTTKKNAESSGQQKPKNLSSVTDLVFEAFNFIPDLQKGPDDLNAAINVLGGEGLSRGAYLFRGILKLVVFKYKFNHDYRLFPTPECQVKPNTLSRWFGFVDQDLQGVLGDVERSLSEHEIKAKLKELQNQVSQVCFDIKSSLVERLNEPGVKMPSILKKAYPGCSG